MQGEGTHPVSEHWEQCRDEVMDKGILPWERGTTVSLELSWPHTGPGGVELSFLPDTWETFPP